MNYQVKNIIQDLPQPDHIKQLPIVVLIMKSSCNCRCKMCDIWLDKKHEELDAFTVSKLLPQLVKLKTKEIALSGGEPLMHSGIEAICREIIASDFKLTLITTGLLLKRHAAWISECINQIYVSLDGPETVHNQIRNIPDAYRKLSDGITAVRKYDPKMKIGGRCTVHRYNFGYLSQTVEAAHSLGLDSISFLAADVQAGNFGRKNDWRDNGLALTTDDLPELRAALNHLYHKHADEFTSGFIVENQQKLELKIYDYYQALAGNSEFPPVHCNAPWISTVIETDGRVRPCFFHQRFDGNIKNLQFHEILNSSKAIFWRRQLDVNTNPVCRTCVCSLYEIQDRPV
jgi:radical SAM protein with 4Fe4S-binding SPASM domain